MRTLVITILTTGTGTTFNTAKLSGCRQQGWTGMYILVVSSLSVKLIKNSHQNLPI